MKITCTVQEFGEIVRQCECCSCEHCVLKELCGDGVFEDAVNVEIVKEDT